MSATTREAAERLRVKYARRFGVWPNDVKIEYFWNDDFEDAALTCPDKPELPRWTLGRP